MCFLHLNEDALTLDEKLVHFGTCPVQSINTHCELSQWNENLDLVD